MRRLNGKAETLTELELFEHRRRQPEWLQYLWQQPATELDKRLKEYDEEI